MKALVTFGTERKNAYKRRMIFTLLILVLFFVQSGYSAFVGMRGVRIFFLIPAIVAISMYERGAFGAGLGLFAGALWDITLSHDGFASAVLFTAAALCGILVSYVMRNNIITGVFLCALSVAAFSALYVFVFYVSEEIDTHGILIYYISSFLLTVLTFPLFYYAVREITCRFTSGRASYVE